MSAKNNTSEPTTDVPETEAAADAKAGGAGDAEQADSLADAARPDNVAEMARRKRELEDLKTSLYIKELESKVSTYESKLSDIREYVKKMEGEIDGIRTRATRDTQRTVDQRLGQFFLSLLNICDNFKLSLHSAEGDKSTLAEGLRMINSQFENFLKQSGLENVATKGEIFDPHQHEAITTEPVMSKEMDQVIVKELRAGYRFKEMTLRPAQVIVGRFESGENIVSGSIN